MKLLIIAFISLAGLTAAAQSDSTYLLQHEHAIAKQQSGTHGGGGNTTGYSFFEGVRGLKMTFRKRVLHAGAAIGYHLQEQDEIYYVLSGQGEMRVNGRRFPLKAGDAVLTRPKNWHGLRQTGKNDLAVLILY